MQYVVTAGAYVNKSGYHGLGRAFDLDIIKWQNAQSAPYYGEHNSSNLALQRRYVGLNACAHRHFRYVLHGWYNSAHGDHIHVDDGGLPLLLVSRVEEQGWRYR